MNKTLRFEGSIVAILQVDNKNIEVEGVKFKEIMR